VETGAAVDTEARAVDVSASTVVEVGSPCLKEAADGGE